MTPRWAKRAVLRFIYVSYLLAAGLPLIEPLGYMVFRGLVIRQTYVSEIIGDPLIVGHIKDSLDFLNKLGDNEVISYLPEYGSASRPVRIEAKEFNKIWELGKSGYASFDFDYCNVYVNVDETDSLEFTETVIHEYLHCLGYPHVPNKNDVMYFSTTPGFTLESITRYAKEIKLWKTLKN